MIANEPRTVIDTLLLMSGTATIWAQSFAPIPPDPEQVYGDLFVKVQMGRIFPDQKTFADAVPKGEVASILEAYRAALTAAGELSPELLKAFVAAHFVVPATPRATFHSKSGESARDHILKLWKVLGRHADRSIPGGSLIPLPHPYIVPGGRFREVFYWDSYFTMLGLKESGRDTLMLDIVRNFAYLLNRFGFIPNGNRTYFLSRSQPPYFALMVDLLASVRGQEVYREFQGALLKEYAYWTDQSYPTHHSVTMPDGSMLSRCYDRSERPRPEAFYQDSVTLAEARKANPNLYRDLRSCAESGWDFSSRWFRDGRHLITIHTTDLVPVDLNCLLFHLEQTIARSYRPEGESGQAALFDQKAEKRKAAINRWCWDAQANWYVDYDLSKAQRNPALTLAGMSPFFFNLAPANRMAGAASVLQRQFLKPGGLITTLQDTGQQWDAPNGWAPLQWIAIEGLENYGQKDLAAEAAHRWLQLIERVHRETGKMMEKYNVVDIGLTAGGGEYPSQDGFGWTNGVFLALSRLYPAK